MAIKNTVKINFLILIEFSCIFFKELRILFSHYKLFEICHKSKNF
jgi:hypothetical protein